MFFGVFRSAIFLALFRQREETAGLDVADAVTYVWVLQCLFGVVFSSWGWEYPDNVRSGDFVLELLRPGGLFGRLMAVDLGRAVFVLMARGLPQLLLPGLIFHMRLPTAPLGILALAASLLLTCLATFEMRFLIGTMAFWTPDFRGWWSVIFGTLWLGAGFVVPVEFFPGPFRLAAMYGPIAALLSCPVRVATGRNVAESLFVQVTWVLVGAAVCRALMSVAERHLVVHGG